MPRKPRLLLCDAVAIITAHAEGVWDSLCVSYEVLVPSIVVAEAHFYRDQAGRRIPIDLQCDIDSGKVSEYTANLVELAATGSMLHPGLRARVDDGEREALTYLRQSPGDDVWFITADGGAIQAAVAFDRGECAQSLATALQRVGITKNLPRHHTDEFVREHRRLGGIQLIEGRALA
jgi:hypothetical protein